MNKKKLQGRLAWRYAAGLLGVFLLLWAGWTAIGRSPEPEPIPVAKTTLDGRHAALAAASAPSSVPLMAAASAAQASSTTAVAAPNQRSSRHSDRATAQQLEQIEAQWCSHAKQAHEQAEASIEQGNPIDWSDFKNIDEKRLEAASQARMALPTSQARYAVRERLLKSWIAQLRNQGDSRSLATAFFLFMSEAAAHEDGWAENAMAFHAEALRTSDPYVLQLWQQGSRRCGMRGTTCQALPKTRWAEIEPNNLLAWLPDFRDAGGLTDAQWQGVAAAGYVRDYQHEFRARLLALLAKTPPGLELETGLGLVTSSYLFGSGISALTMHRECNKPDAAGRFRNACLHAANLFWNAPQTSVADRAMALSMSEKRKALGDVEWAQRFAELKALSPEMQMALRQAESEPKDWNKSCDKLPARRQRLLDIAEGGSWKAAQTLLAKGAAR
jgi:hypothetical protein